MTCIDCHQGIAHDLPPGYMEEYQKVVDRLAGVSLEADTLADASEIRDYLSETAK